MTSQQQRWPLVREASEEVTVTHRVNCTMYCEAIRKKDEMTKQISTWSSAGLCAVSHRSAAPTTHRLLLLFNRHHHPETHLFQLHKSPLGKRHLLWYYSAVRHLSYINLRTQIKKWDIILGNQHRIWDHSFPYIMVTKELSIQCREAFWCVFLYQEIKFINRHGNDSQHLG